MQTESFQRTGRFIRQALLRKAALILTALIFITMLLPLTGGGLRISRTLLIGILTAAGASLAFMTAARFDRSEAGWLVWSLIGCAGMADFLMFTIFLVPVLLGVRDAMSALVVVVAALIMLSRIAVAVALWTTVRVYKRTGLGFHVLSRDYGVMACLIAASGICVALSGSIARSQVSDEALASAIQLVGLPLLAALAVSSVLGVIVWRYAKQMGGGLVARAWQSILLYTALWLVRLSFLGVLAFAFNISATNRSVIVSRISLAVLLLAEYVLFCGASYQYEACTGRVAPVPVDQPKAFAAVGG